MSFNPDVTPEQENVSESPQQPVDSPVPGVSDPAPESGTEPEGAVPSDDPTADSPAVQTGPGAIPAEGSQAPADPAVTAQPVEGPPSEPVAPVPVAEGTAPVPQPAPVPGGRTVKLSDGTRMEVTDSVEEIEEAVTGAGEFITLSHAASDATVKVRVSAIIAFE